MTERLTVLGGLAVWVGVTLLLSELRWFSRVSLVERLRPYGPDGLQRGRGGILSVATFRDVIGPVSRAVAERVSRTFGVHEDLSIRLARVHSPLDATAFRTRQLGWSVSGFGAAVAVDAVLRPPALVAFLILVGAPLLAFLVVEQQLATASDHAKRRITHELPVLAEQLAMLVCAGFSLGAAIDRVARRGRGHCARDLARVCERVRHGLSETDALREYAAVADVPALDRLVLVLALHREAPDLGRLLSEEARAIRREIHRQLVVAAERRAQQVWIPVTVAALLPGVIFICVPFIQALRVFSGS